ncbi:L-threonylcarbamoyladenylate synthase [Arundinibacter roseus]|uniref:Threonylcarbamoyl-AMP synthase n=1 Tax=Arundinibacter roseus TaxID=2070510 RepID=A0A4R4K9T3_9BACT|nr:L-threonylcarbamoyladenylate synthase [Arundinibacter roseus]TDB64518.1 threonylcarbamoyl-AMP synthase [Arundinibacter roseus]
MISTDLALAEKSLREGKLVGIPTETVYGLAANALNSDAVLSIFEVKNRPAFDPLIIHTDSMASALKYVEDFPEKAQLLANAFWPGPLTLLLPKKSIIPDLVTSGLETVAIRVPNHPLTLHLLNRLDFPLAAPSANPFGYVSPTRAVHVDDQLGTKIAMVLDGGACEVGIESTIVSFQSDEPVVVRVGGLRLEDIEAVIGKIKTTLHSSSNPLAPGMLKSHYAPRKPLFLMTKDEMRNKVPEKEVGYLFFQEAISDTENKNQLILSSTGDFREAAQNLFAFMRKLDTLPISKIWAEKLPNHDLGRAINDRLLRASVR